MNNQISISFRIGERIYPMKIFPQEESIVRHAEAMIRERVEYFKSKYPDRDLCDWLVFSALHFSRNLLYKEDLCSIEEVEARLLALDRKMEEVLNIGEPISIE